MRDFAGRARVALVYITNTVAVPKEKYSLRFLNIGFKLPRNVFHELVVLDY